MMTLMFHRCQARGVPSEWHTDTPSPRLVADTRSTLNGLDTVVIRRRASRDKVGLLRAVESPWPRCCFVLLMAPPHGVGRTQAHSGRLAHFTLPSTKLFTCISAFATGGL